jgi:hypothetical protein
VHHKGGRVGVRLVANRVSCSTRESNNLSPARSKPLRRCVRSAGVKGELAVDDVVDLARIVSMQYGGGPPPGGMRTMTANDAPPVSALVANTVSSSVPNVSRSAVSESTGDLAIFLKILNLPRRQARDMSALCVQCLPVLVRATFQRPPSACPAAGRGLSCHLVRLRDVGHRWAYATKVDPLLRSH